jgi:lysophospholipase L1-like esterase
MIRNSGRISQDWENPYIDVMDKQWSYQYITELNRLGVFADSKEFRPKENETRGELVLALYNMDSNVFSEEKKAREKAQKESLPTPSFEDVPKSSDYYDAVRWAYGNGLVSGTSETTFDPDADITREQVCLILARFAALEEVQLVRLVEPDQFMDSIYISSYARSGVTVCQMACIVKGYDDGFFYPANTMTRQECAAAIYRLMVDAQTESLEGDQFIDLAEGAYDSLYDSYTDIPFTALVPESDTPGDASFFDQVVFIGDSVSLTLEAYSAATGSLGKAQFLCAGSMSASNMITGKILPEYPKGSGQTPAIEESVAACGAKVVYIMLGMDNIAYGTERATSDMVTIINNITTRNPDVTIVVQSVTPMADSSTSYSDMLNNDTITAYNERMAELCQENRWYYVDVAEAVKDSSGFLNQSYCSDYGKMGMHFNYTGAQVWVDYLLSHIPDALV